MFSITIIFVLLYGLVIGSFLNVCIYRIPKGESIAYPPSHCGICNGQIKPYDLIPIFSYLFLRGKCRNCGEKISIRYPMIELVNGLLYVAVFYFYGFSYITIKYIILITFLIIIGMIDLDTTDIYFKTTLPCIVIGILFAVYSHIYNENVMNYLSGALLGGGIIALIILLTKGMGWGDAEICLMCGIYLGFKLTIVMLFLSFVLGGLIGTLLIITKVKSRKDYIPFGPFIALASIITILFGEKMINWYLNIL